MNEIGKNIHLIAFYARVSTSNQEDQKTIDNQIIELRKRADELFGVGSYIVVREYKDEGWSGDTLVRPDLDQLRVDAKRKIWDTVLIYDPDRLARRYSYQELVTDELREAGIEVIFVTISAPKNSEDKILSGVRGLFAEYERVKITERFRLGKLRKANNGNIIMSEGPYGLILVRRKGKPGDSDFVETHLTRNENEILVLRMIFEWIAYEGLTLRRVVKRLEERGVSPRKSKRGVWNTSTLSTLVRNRAYIGEAHYGASYAIIPVKPLKDEKYKKYKKTSRKMRPENEWIVIRNIPVIFDSVTDREMFERAQAQLKRNFEMSQRNKKNQYLLAGKFRCACGRSRAGEGPQRGKYLYYRCTGRVHSYPLPPECVEKGINARIADGVVWDKLTELMSSKELMAEQIQRWKQRKQSTIGSPIADVEMLKRRIAELKKQEDRYSVAYGEGVLSLTKLKELTAPIRDKIVAHAAQIEKAEAAKTQTISTTFPDDGEIETFAASASDRLKNLSFERKRAIVVNVVDKVTGTHGEILVRGHVPVATLAPEVSANLLMPSPYPSTMFYVEFKTSDRNRRFA